MKKDLKEMREVLDKSFSDPEAEQTFKETQEYPKSVLSPDRLLNEDEL